MKTHPLLFVALTLATLVLLLVPDTAFASGTGAGGGEFSEILDFMKGLAQGTFGRALTVLSLIVSVIIGLARQSLMSGLVTLGVALMLIHGPTVIDNLFAFALPVVA